MAGTTSRRSKSKSGFSGGESYHAAHHTHGLVELDKANRGAHLAKSVRATFHLKGGLRKSLSLKNLAHFLTENEINISPNIYKLVNSLSVKES